MQSLIAPEAVPAFALAPEASSLNRAPADVTALSVSAPSSPSAMQRLLFLHPKTLVDSWPFPVDTLGEVVKAPSAVYPVLASFVSDLPLEIEIFDGYVTRESFANYKQRLRRADFIAISQMSPLKALDTELTIRLAKALNPQVLVILGGNHASSFPDSWIERGADFVVVGEGETAFPKLMETILSGKQDFSDVPNLVYRHGEGSRATGIKAAEADLNASPLPRWDLVDFGPYDLGLRTGGKTAAIEVSRGCPHRCDFCNINTYWGHRQRYKSVARVCDELEQLHRLGVREFIFTDDNFAQDHRHTAQLLQEMVRRKLGMRFGSFMRGDTVNRHPEFVELAAKAGMSFCLMGIETLDPRWLKNHSKGVRANDVVSMYGKVYRTLKGNGISVIGLFITPAEADAEFVSGGHADGVVCDAHYTADLAALKGSALYDKLVIENSVAKDMFYHDWNLPSIKLQDGREQTSRKKLRPTKRWNVAAFKTALIGPMWARRFHRRNLSVIAERLLCSSWADIQRYRMAKNPLVPLASRQAYIVDSVINPQFLAKLLRGRRHKSPLALRNGLWSDRPPQIVALEIYPLRKAANLTLGVLR